MDPALAVARIPEPVELLETSVDASSGDVSYEEEARDLRWQVKVAPQTLVTLRFSVRVLPTAQGATIDQIILVSDALGGKTLRLGTTVRMGPMQGPLQLPLILRAER